VQAEERLSDLTCVWIEDIVLRLVLPERNGLLLNDHWLLNTQVNGRHHRSGKLNEFSDDSKFSARSLVLPGDLGHDGAW
jgi:hypothetical protein